MIFILEQSPEVDTAKGAPPSAVRATHISDETLLRAFAVGRCPWCAAHQPTDWKAF